MKRTAFGFAALAALAFLISGPGTRFGWFRFTIGLRLFALSVPFAAIALSLAMIVALREKKMAPLTTTSWFGFTDDVVVRIRPLGSGSRVDVRSCSRVGRGDAGENAKRVRAFLRLMK